MGCEIHIDLGTDCSQVWASRAGAAMARAYFPGPWCAAAAPHPHSQLAPGWIHRIVRFCAWLLQ